MSVDKKQDLILNTQDFQQGQLPSCDEDSEGNSTPEPPAAKKTLNKNQTKTGSKNKNVPIEDDRTSSSSEGSESSASFVAIQFDATEDKQFRFQQKPVPIKNTRSIDNSSRWRDQNTKSFLSSEKNMQEERPKHHQQNIRNYHQQQPYYQKPYPQNSQYFAPHPNSYMYSQPQPQFRNPQPNFYPNTNNMYVNPNMNHNLIHNTNSNVFHQGQYQMPSANPYNYQMGGYNNFHTPKYPPTPFNQPQYDHHQYKNSRHQMMYKQKSEMKTIIGNILNNSPQKQQIIRLILQTVVSNGNELCIGRLAEHWMNKEYGTKIEQVLKVIQTDDIIRKLYQYRQEVQALRKKQQLATKKDPRKRD